MSPPTSIRVAQVSEIPDGTGKELMAGDQIIAVYRVGGEFFAMDGICPHAGGPLGEGKLTGSVVTCPWHGWQFDVTTGRHCLNHKLFHRTYAVRIEGEELFVDVG